MRNSSRLAGLTASVLLAAGAPARAAEDDAGFVKAAASGGMLEVALGQHAAKHATEAEVRAFGEHMVLDHAKANLELKAVAEGAGLALPSEMEEEDRDALQKLSKLRGSDFDKSYMDAMVKNHERAVESFRAQAAEQKSAVDRWAAKTLPTLEDHLKGAETLAGQLGKIEDQGSGGAGGSSNVGGDAGRALDPSVTGISGRP